MRNLCANYSSPNLFLLQRGRGHSGLLHPADFLLGLVKLPAWVLYVVVSTSLDLRISFYFTECHLTASCRHFSCCDSLLYQIILPDKHDHIAHLNLLHVSRNHWEIRTYSSSAVHYSGAPVVKGDLPLASSCGS